MDAFGKKQPWDAYFVDFDFTNLLTTGDTIHSATVTATNISTGADVTDTITTVASQSIVSPKVFVWVKGGTSGVNYKITCRVVTHSTPAEQYELDAKLPVMEF